MFLLSCLFSMPLVVFSGDASLPWIFVISVHLWYDIVLFLNFFLKLVRPYLSYFLFRFYLSSSLRRSLLCSVFELWFRVSFHIWHCFWWCLSHAGGLCDSFPLLHIGFWVLCEGFRFLPNINNSSSPLRGGNLSGLWVSLDKMCPLLLVHRRFISLIHGLWGQTAFIIVALVSLMDLNFWKLFLDEPGVIWFFWESF